MKRQNIAALAGTMALLANLLIPGLAFGQGTQQQQGTQVITCPEDGGTAEFSMSVPSAVNFDEKTVSSQQQWSFDRTISDSLLSAQNVISVTDTRSGGVDGCPTNLKGFTITASATALFDIQEGYSIPNTNLFIRTSSAYTGAANCVEGACYDLATDQSGNTQDVIAAYDLADPFRDQTGTSYSSSNSLNTPRTILSTSTSHNQTIKTGVIIAEIIPANQSPGTYIGAITYTIAKQ